MRWEYRIYFIYGDNTPKIARTINDLGQDGWELVTSTDNRLYFKRPA